MTAITFQRSVPPARRCGPPLLRSHLRHGHVVALLVGLFALLPPAGVRAQAFGFGAPAPLNTNAATDSGIDGWPSVVTDGAGTWVAVWHTGDTLGGTIGGEWGTSSFHAPWTMGRPGPPPLP